MEDNRFKKITLLHSNDMHGDFFAEKIDDNSSIHNGELEESYIAINLMSADVDTRAASDSYGYDEGTVAEREIKSAYFFFFNEDGKTIISFTEFGALVKATELYAVVSNKSENAILVFNRTTGEKTDWMKYEYNNTFLNGKYIIFKGTFESTKGYSLYDPEKKQFLFQNCSYMEVFGNYLTVYDDEFITVYNDKLEKVLKCARGWAE